MIDCSHNNHNQSIEYTLKQLNLMFIIMLATCLALLIYLIENLIEATVYALRAQMKYIYKSKGFV